MNITDDNTSRSAILLSEAIDKDIEELVGWDTAQVISFSIFSMKDMISEFMANVDVSSL